MPRYLNTRGNTTLAIGICGRCSIKMPLDQLLPDPNYPGLLVCERDRDQYDPYRLPDVPLATNPAGVIAQNSEQFLITEDSDDYLIFFEDDEF